MSLFTRVKLQQQLLRDRMEGQRLRAQRNQNGGATPFVNDFHGAGSDNFSVTPKASTSAMQKASDSDNVADQKLFGMGTFAIIATLFFLIRAS